MSDAKLGRRTQEYAYILRTTTDDSRCAVAFQQPAKAFTDLRPELLPQVLGAAVRLQVGAPAEQVQVLVVAEEEVVVAWEAHPEHWAAMALLHVRARDLALARAPVERSG